MSESKQDDALAMCRARFSIKTIAATIGESEWTVADYLIQCGAIRRRR